MGFGQVSGDQGPSGASATGPTLITADQRAYVPGGEDPDPSPVSSTAEILAEAVLALKKGTFTRWWIQSVVECNRFGCPTPLGGWTRRNLKSLNDRRLRIICHPDKVQDPEMKKLYSEISQGCGFSASGPRASGP